MTQPHYTRDDLHKTMRDCIIRQEWESVFAPPEGVEGRGGADPTTELKGFKKDADYMIVAPMLEKFPQGGKTADIADALTDLAYSQKNASAGAFARFMALNIRDRIAPDYLAEKAAETLPKSSAGDILTHLQETATSSDSRQILDNLSARLLDKQGVTPEQVVGELQKIGDEYARTGDEYLADEADIVRDAAKQRIAADTKPDAVKSIAQEWKAQERNWQNPMQDKLTQKSVPEQKAQQQRSFNR